MIQSVKGNGREPDGPPDLFELMKKLTGGGRARGRSRGNFGGGVIAINWCDS